MGCCVSTDGGGDGGSESRGVRRFDEKATSFTSTEEETVKEVLSETPARPACFVSRDNAAGMKMNNVSSGYNPRRNAGVHDVGMMKNGQRQETASERDEISEGERRDSNEYYRHGQSQSRDRTPVKMYPKSKSFSGEVGRRRSPVRKSSDPSPGRRMSNDGGSGGGGAMAVRSVSSRDSPQKAAWGRPEAGERSRSPGMRAGGGVGRSPSGRKVQGQSPNRTRGTAAESSRRNEEEKWGQADESLENPLVALECFIFL
uniref:Uncharacterized protein n=1 Tax=Kalanchoe fedtschenkoi TaxID=63787 RepID=A0A7N0VLR4_KALFE